MTTADFSTLKEFLLIMMIYRLCCISKPLEKKCYLNMFEVLSCSFFICPRKPLLFGFRFSAGGINSMMNGLTFALSPLAGILSDRIGIRTTCCIGSLIAFIGLILSSFAQNIYQLVVTFGVLLGKLTLY